MGLDQNWMPSTADGGGRRVMLVGRDRVFYFGLLGQPTVRNFGCATLYASAHSGTSGLQINMGDGWRSCTLAWVPPYVPHRVRCHDRHLAAIMIEPESVALDVIERYMEKALCPERKARLHQRILTGLARLQQTCESKEITTSEFDRLFLGEPLPVRELDPRIQRSLDRLCGDLSGEVGGEALAGAEELSFSRFLHLFKEDTGVSLRKYRAWRRARSLLYHVTRDVSLTDIALETGYPDSTHFSHSIRRIYGLSPRTIVAGSRRLSVRLQPDGDGRVSPELALASLHKSTPESAARVGGMPAMAG